MNFSLLFMFSGLNSFLPGFVFHIKVRASFACTDLQKCSSRTERRVFLHAREHEFVFCLQKDRIPEDAAGVDKPGAVFSSATFREGLKISDDQRIHFHSTASAFTLLKNLLRALGFT